jgi:hypothetical protein
VSIIAGYLVKVNIYYETVGCIMGYTVVSGAILIKERNPGNIYAR